ncbi:MAG: Tim44/TimA family putative adaptor protein [Alphaproteobacteria bacterium]
MGGEGFLGDIFVFAVIAGFLAYRLRNVLGQRGEDEKQRPNPFASSESLANKIIPNKNFSPNTSDQASNKIIDFPGNPVQQPLADYSTTSMNTDGLSLEASIEKIRYFSAGFEEKIFLDAARKALGMIIESVAKGQTSVLNRFVGGAALKAMENIIESRKTQGFTAEAKILRFIDTEIVKAEIRNQNALITVKFLTEQLSIVKDEKGNFQESTSAAPFEAEDLCVFSRKIDSADPTWTLISLS